MSFSTRVILARRLRFLPDHLFAVAVHALFQGEFSTLRNPRTYAQLLAAKNLGPQDELVHLTTDKYAVRAHVTERIGSEYLIPLIQVIERAEDITGDSVARPCVVKATHGCDMTLLLPVPGTVALATVRARVRTWLRTDFYGASWHESPYRGLPRRAVVEELIGDGVAAPTDYKFFMFHGRPAMVVVDQDRFTSHTSTLLSPDWEEYAVTGRFAAASTLPEQPANYSEMLAIAEQLSKEFAFVRIDLYNVDGRIYFGEITHNPGGGLVRLQPRAFDLALGEMWRNGTPVPSTFVRRREPTP